MAKPDKYSYEQSIDLLNDEIEAIKSKRGKILKTIKARQSGGAGFREEKDKARKTMGVLVKTKNGIMDERKVLFAQRDAIRAATDRMKEASRNMKGELGRYTSVQDIDNKIRQLHHRQNTTNMSLSEEKDLIKQIDLFPSVISVAASSHNPALVANYVYDLVKSFNSFYQSLPILKSAFEDKKTFRVELSNLVGITIKNALSLLGIGVVNRM